MVAAHKHGRILAQIGKSPVWLQTLLTTKFYKTEQEREAFAAGYLGEQRRIQSNSNVT